MELFLYNLVTSTNYANYDPTLYVMSDASFQNSNAITEDNYLEGNIDVQIAQGLGEQLNSSLLLHSTAEWTQFLDSIDM